MIGGFRIGRIFGIEIRLDWSWIFIFVLMTWSLTSTLAVWHLDWSPGMDFVLGLVGSCLFFGSVILHELAHAAVANMQGLPVNSITLFLFGGVSNIEREPSSPRVEFFTAIVGPTLSLALGFLLLLGTGMTSGLPPTALPSAVYIATLGPFATMSLWLGTVNVLIGTFNLVPAFPLDGGRVLRSAIWALTHDLRSSTQAAALIGQIFGWTFVLLGITMSFGAVVPVFGTGLGSGLWLAFIGWFLASAAAQSVRRVLVDEALSGLTVMDLMRRSSTVFPAQANIGDIVREGFMRTDERAFPVVEEGRLVGLVSVDDVRATPQAAWGTTKLRQILTPIEKLSGASPSEPLTEALVRMTRLGVDQLPVLRNGELAGMLHQRDIARWLELQSGHGGPGHTTPRHQAFAH